MPRYIFPVLLLLCFGIYGQDSQLRLASDVYPPFTDKSGKQAFALELVHEALERSNVNAGSEILDFGEVLQMINDGKFDGSAALWKSKDRETYLIFSEPYLENRLVLVGRAGSDVSASSISELKNKRVSTVSGYAYGSSIYTTPGVIILPGKSDQDNLETLLEGKTDYMLVDELLIKYLLEYQHNEVKKYLSVGSKAIIVQPLHLAILKETPNADQIIADFNNNIQEMMTDGTYNQILELNWIQYDVDGDGILELVLDGENAGEEPPVNYYALMSSSGLSSPSDRYYINGNMYDGWNSVPDKFKKDFSNTAGRFSSESAGLKLKF